MRAYKKVQTSEVKVWKVKWKGIFIVEFIFKMYILKVIDKLCWFMGGASFFLKAYYTLVLFHIQDFGIGVKWVRSLSLLLEYYGYKTLQTIDNALGRFITL